MTTLILPAKNAEKTIGKAIKSVISLAESTPIQLIVIEDGSSDRTLDIIRENFCQTEKFEVTVVSNPLSIGPGPSRNSALKLAKGKSIGFIDADDALMPEQYLKVISEAQSGNFDIIIFDDVKGVYDRQRSKGLLDSITRFELLRRMQIDGSVIYSLFSTQLIVDHQLQFGRHYFEDIQFQYGAIAVADKIKITPEKCYVKTNTSGSILNSFTPRHVDGVISVLNWMDQTLQKLDRSNISSDDFLADVAYGVRGLLYQTIVQGHGENDSLAVLRLTKFIESGLDLERVLFGVTESKKDLYLKKLTTLINHEKL